MFYIIINALDTVEAEFSSNRTLPHSTCVWNALELKCVPNTKPLNTYRHILTQRIQCQQDNIQAGITLLKYYHPHNYSDPDEVLILPNTNTQTSFDESTSKYTFFKTKNKPANRKFSTKKQNSTLFNVARILGYLHPLGIQPYNENFVRLYLASTSPQASFYVNNISQKLQSTTLSKTKFNSVVEFPINISGDLVVNSFLIDYIVQFPIRTSSNRLEYEKIQIKIERNHSKSDPEVITYNNFTPYYDIDQCALHTTCSSCLSNLACAWCSNSSRCLTRSNSIDCQSDFENSISLVISPNECPKCKEYASCDQCVLSRDQSCEWLLPDGICVRSGRFQHSIGNASLCPTKCHQRMSCESCLDETNYCMWCESTKMCIFSTTYYSSVMFDFCHPLESSAFSLNQPHLKGNFLSKTNLKYSQIQCNKCLRHSICSMCQNDLNCDWCYLDTDPTLGFCGMKNSTQAGKCFLDFNLPPKNNRSQNFIRLHDSCPQIDECRLHTDNCHEHAVCVDTDESFKCFCKPGYTGNGIVCVQTCHPTCVHGYCSDFPDYQCICDLGWTGVDCNTDCQCNFHSTCREGVGKCDFCEDNTKGTFCAQCVEGTFGNATNSKGCQVCDCNGHGDQKRGSCHPQSGICFCNDHTEGIYCERCATGYYGNPKNGNHCFLECHHRTLISEVTFGYFGSYIRDIHFSKYNHLFDRNNFYINTNIHCLWMFTTFASPAKFDSLTKYFETALKVARPVPIVLDIFQSMNVNCSTSSVIVYDGLPRFVTSQSNLTQSTILANLCAVNSPRNIRLIATTGFATVLYISDDLNQGFNASYQRLSEPIPSNLSKFSNSYIGNNKTSIFLPDHNKRDFKISIENNWKFDSNYHNTDYWPRIMHTLHYYEDNLIFIGGHPDSLQLPVSVFNLKTSEWMSTNQTINSLLKSRHFHATVMLNHTIYLFGGLNHLSNEVLNDFWACKVSSKSENLEFAWEPLHSENIDSIPSLIGHSLTSVRFNGADAILLIGGYSPDFGLLDKQYIYSPALNKWSDLVTKGASPVGIFAHSSVYHPPSNSLYLFGGVDFKELQKVTISNTLYVLDLKKLIWHQIQPTNINHKHFPLPRYLHVAASTENYMILFGGRTHNPSDKTYQMSVYAYSYRCNSWLSLNNDSFWNSDRPFLHMFQAVSVTNDLKNKLYLYQATMTPSLSSTFSESINAFQLPKDFCILFSKNKNECLNMLGCSFCHTKSSSNHTSVCFDRFIEVPSDCEEEKTVHGNQKCLSANQNRDCNAFTNCVDCTTQNYDSEVDEEQNCQWCTDCHYKEGKCIKLNDTCDDVSYSLNEAALCHNISIEYPVMCPLRRCLATDCDKCLQYSKQHSNSNHRLECVWTRQVYKFIRFGHTLNINPIFDWACIESSIIEATMQLSDMETIPPLSCPARCHKHRTCSLCLDEANGDESGSHECVWSELTHECMSPTYALLRCEHGLCGGFVHRRLHSQCPLNCETYNKASECLATLHCGWCAVGGFHVDGMGVCMKGGLFGAFNQTCTSTNKHLMDHLANHPFYKPLRHFSTAWHYLYPPKGRLFSFN